MIAKNFTTYLSVLVLCCLAVEVQSARLWQYEVNTWNLGGEAVTITPSPFIYTSSLEAFEAACKEMAAMGSVPVCSLPSMNVYGWCQLGNPECESTKSGKLDVQASPDDSNCPTGEQFNETTGLCEPVEYFLQVGEVTQDNLGAPSCPSPSHAGNPIHLASGNKYQAEGDLNGPGSPPLRLTRFYNSEAPQVTVLGVAWRHSYARALMPIYYGGPPAYEGSAKQSARFATSAEACEVGWGQIRDQYPNSVYRGATATYEGGRCTLYYGGTFIADAAVHPTAYRAPTDPTPIAWEAHRPDGKVIRFSRGGSGAWRTSGTRGMALVENADGFVLTTNDNTVERYDAGGRLLSIAQPDGRVQTLSYSSARLQRVDDNLGNALVLDYGADNRLSTVTYNGTRQWGYRYNADGLLAYVDNPDGTTRQYHYDNPGYPHALTGITDERGNRYATFEYDAEGRAIASYHAGDAVRVDISYNTDGTTTVTNSRGQTTTYTFTDTAMGQQITTVNGPGCATCGP